MWPSKRQWSNWSLPSKLTAIGTYVGLISFVFSIAIFIIGKENSTNVLESEAEFNLLTRLDISGINKVEKVKKSDIPKLLDSVFSFEGHENESITVTMINGNDDSERIAVTCREYNYLLNTGYYPKTNWDVKFASRLKKSCGTLKYLLLAEKASKSFIKKLKSDKETLDLIPGELLNLSVVSYSNDEIPTSIGMLDKRVELTRVAGNNHYDNICFEIDKTEGFCLQAMALADINQDGIEDLIMYIHIYYVGGSLSYGDVYVFTRFNESSTYMLLKS